MACLPMLFALGRLNSVVARETEACSDFTCPVLVLSPNIICFGNRKPNFSLSHIPKAPFTWTREKLLNEISAGKRGSSNAIFINMIMRWLTYQNKKYGSFHHLDIQFDGYTHVYELIRATRDKFICANTYAPIGDYFLLRAIEADLADEVI